MIFSDVNLARKIEGAEARNNVNFIEARRVLFPEIGAEWIETAGAFALFDGASSPCTQTFGLGMFAEATAADFDKIEAFFTERGAHVLHEVSPLADASVLSLLNERGYQPLEYTSVLYMPLAAGDATDLDLQLNPKIKTRIIEPEEALLWAQTSADSWSAEPEMADFRAMIFDLGRVNATCKNGFSFIAEIEGKPIATAMLFIEDDTAILAGASTLPAERKQGGQTALLDARLRFTAARGCAIAAMGALPGSQSQRNAEKNGFRIAYTRTKWQLKS